MKPRRKPRSKLPPLRKQLLMPKRRLRMTQLKQRKMPRRLLLLLMIASLRRRRRLRHLPLLPLPLPLQHLPLPQLLLRHESIVMK